MLTKLLQAILISSLSLTSAYALDSNKNTNTDKQQNKDNEILAILVVLNNNEINAANHVLPKTSNQQIKDYANMMVKDHTENLEETNQLSEKLNAKLVDTKKVMTLKKKGEKEVMNLSKLKPEQVDKTYINDMVTDHTEALNMIDKDLLKNASNEDIKKHLTATREHVSHHLEEAKSIKTTLKA